MVEKRCSRCRATKAEEHFKTIAGKPRETCDECRAKDVKKRTKARRLAREQRAIEEAAGTPNGEAPPPMSHGVSAFSLADPFGPAPSPSPPPQPRQARKIKFRHAPPPPVVPPAPGHQHYNVSPHMPPPPGHMLIAHQVPLPVQQHQPSPHPPTPTSHRIPPPAQPAAQPASPHPPPQQPYQAPPSASPTAVHTPRQDPPQASWGNLFAQAPEERDMISMAVKMALAGSGNTTAKMARKKVRKKA